jgi:hypothetical protein
MDFQSVVSSREPISLLADSYKVDVNRDGPEVHPTITRHFLKRRFLVQCDEPIHRIRLIPLVVGNHNLRIS